MTQHPFHDLPTRVPLQYSPPSPIPSFGSNQERILGLPTYQINSRPPLRGELFLAHPINRNTQFFYNHTRPMDSPQPVSDHDGNFNDEGSLSCRHLSSQSHPREASDDLPRYESYLSAASRAHSFPGWLGVRPATSTCAYHSTPLLIPNIIQESAVASMSRAPPRPTTTLQPLVRVVHPPHPFSAGSTVALVSSIEPGQPSPLVSTRSRTIVPTHLALDRRCFITNPRDRTRTRAAAFPPTNAACRFSASAFPGSQLLSSPLSHENDYMHQTARSFRTNGNVMRRRTGSSIPSRPWHLPHVETAFSRTSRFQNFFGLISRPSTVPSEGSMDNGRTNQLARSFSTEESEQEDFSTEGIPPKLLEILPTERYRRGRIKIEARSTCMICQFDYAEEDVIRRLPCLHHFHLECIDQWLGSQVSCPVCRISVLSGIEECDLDAERRTILVAQLHRITAMEEAERRTNTFEEEHHEEMTPHSISSQISFDQGLVELQATGQNRQRAYSELQPPTSHAITTIPSLLFVNEHFQPIPMTSQAGINSGRRVSRTHHPGPLTQFPSARSSVARERMVVQPLQEAVEAFRENQISRTWQQPLAPSDNSQPLRYHQQSDSQQSEQYYTSRVVGSATAEESGRASNTAVTESFAVESPLFPLALPLYEPHGYIEQQTSGTSQDATTPNQNYQSSEDYSDIQQEGRDGIPHRASTALSSDSNVLRPLGASRSGRLLPSSHGEHNTNTCHNDVEALDSPQASSSELFICEMTGSPSPTYRLAWRIANDLRLTMNHDPSSSSSSGIASTYGQTTIATDDARLEPQGESRTNIQKNPAVLSLAESLEWHLKVNSLVPEVTNCSTAIAKTSQETTGCQ